MRLLLTFVVLLMTFSLEAQSVGMITLPQAVGGVTTISGEMAYTGAYFGKGVSEPVVLLEDQTGFLTHNQQYVIPQSAQVLGQFTTDFTVSPVRFRLSLPAEPTAPRHDVDNNDTVDAGVMIFSLSFWSNVWGDSFLDERDLQGGGWSTAYSSVLSASGALSSGEYTGGSLIIYAPDDHQAFPAGFGPDGRLFTADDPVVTVAQGYTVVDLDAVPFGFRRQATEWVDILEGGSSAADDFSGLDYVSAFDAMIDKFRREYAFTDAKQLDWEALSAEFRPRVEQIQHDKDADAFSTLLQEFVWRIPDGHITVSFSLATYQQFAADTDGGIGMAIREADDQTVYVTLVTANSPATQAGIQPGARLLSINGVAAADYIRAVERWANPASTPDAKRLQQERYAMRFPVGSEVILTIANPDEAEQTVTLVAVAEVESFFATSQNAAISPVALPVEARVLSSGYLLITVNGFLDNQRLTIALWERALQAAQRPNIRGVILDMRHNAGGNGYLARAMAAYFFDEPLVTGQTARYDAVLNQFYTLPEPDRFILPPAGQRYRGRVAVLVGPACASACEFFSDDMTLDKRAEIVGQYPTAGLGGGVEIFYMPDNLQMQITTVRALDPQGNIHIEGRGVLPTVRVPVDEATLFSEDDVVLSAAIAALDAK